jgi:hypothetical protein
MRSSTKVALVLGGVTAVSGGLVWYLWDKGFGAGGGHASHGFTPWLFRGRSSGLPGGMTHSPQAGIVRGGFGTTAHAISGSSGG